MSSVCNLPFNGELAVYASELIESLTEKFEDLGYDKEIAVKLACHARSLMELCDVSKSQVVTSLNAMMHIGRTDALNDLTNL